MKKTGVVMSNSRGFSLVELLIVMTVMLILSAAVFFNLNAHQRLYKPDDQSLKIVDVLQEARQRALTQRETMRVEIDTTAKMVRLIDENRADTAGDDKIIKQVPLLAANEVRIDARPSDITYDPPEPIPVPLAVYKQSAYPMSANNQVCTLRFTSNGSVLNAGNGSIGSGAVPTGVSLHIWSPKSSNQNASEIARAVTIIGTTGSIRFWTFDRSSTDANKWKDSRIAGGYGK